MPIFGTIPDEPRRITAIDGLAPAFARKLDELLGRLREAGYDPILAETLRTPERAAWLYGFGRDYDDDRGVVSGSQTGATTWHSYGLAADLWDGGRPKDPWAIGRTAFGEALIATARAVGLRPAVDWPSSQQKLAEGRAGEVDWPHVQWSPMRDRPSAIAERYHAGGDLRAVWLIVGADT